MEVKQLMDTEICYNRIEVAMKKFFILIMLAIALVFSPGANAKPEKANNSSTSSKLSQVSSSNYDSSIIVGKTAEKVIKTKTIKTENDEKWNRSTGVRVDNSNEDGTGLSVSTTVYNDKYIIDVTNYINQTTDERTTSVGFTVNW